MNNACCKLVKKQIFWFVEEIVLALLISDLLATLVASGYLSVKMEKSTMLLSTVLLKINNTLTMYFLIRMPYLVLQKKTRQPVPLSFV